MAAPSAVFERNKDMSILPELLYAVTGLAGITGQHHLYGAPARSDSLFTIYFW